MVPLSTMAVAELPRAGFHAGLNDGGAAVGLGVGLEFEHFRLEDEKAEKVVDAVAGQGGDFHAFHVAAEVRGNQSFLHQAALGLDGVCGRKVAFVDGHDDGFAGRLGVGDGFPRLGHDAVIGGHYQYHDVRHVRAAGAHFREDGVSRGIQEGEGAAVVFHRIGADVLGDAPGFPLGYARLADVVQQGGFAVVHMAHDGDDGRAQDEGGLGFFHHRHGFRFLDRFLLGLDAAALFPFFTGEGVAVQVADGADGVRVQRRIRVGEDAHAHQVLDDLEGLGLQHACQLGDGDGRLEVDDFIVCGVRFLGGRRGRFCGGCGLGRGGSRLGGSGGGRFFLGAGKQVESFFLDRGRTGWRGAGSGWGARFFLGDPPIRSNTSFLGSFSSCLLGILI